MVMAVKDLKLSGWVGLREEVQMPEPDAVSH